VRHTRGCDHGRRSGRERAGRTDGGRRKGDCESPRRDHPAV